jgi:hypothetical protein
MFRQKNSSLSMLLDSTTSMMRTASTTFQCMIGSVRRASYCGEPDPTIQLSANGNSGSLYLFSGGTNSHESSMSNISHDEQKRTVTIYDGRIPAAPSAPTIPFELMTPIDAITQTIEDPVESFVQIVLEAPDDRPPVILPLAASSSPRSSVSRHRHRSKSPSSLSLNERLGTSDKSPTETQSLPVTKVFSSMETHSQPPVVVEPMDFSFLEPVLRGQSAAPPPMRTPSSRQKSLQNSLSSQDSATDFRSSTSTVPHNDRSSDNSITSPSRLRVPFSTD